MLEVHVKPVLDEVFAHRAQTQVQVIVGVECPANKRVTQTLAGCVRVEVGVGVFVMTPVYSRPPNWRALIGEVSADHEKILEKLVTAESAMSKQSVVADRNAQPMPQVKKQKQHYEGCHEYPPKSLSRLVMPAASMDYKRETRRCPRDVIIYYACCNKLVQINKH